MAHERAAFRSSPFLHAVRNENENDPADQIHFVLSTKEA